MTKEKAIKLIRNELACVETDICDHFCGDCMLAGNTEEIVEALNMAIDALKTAALTMPASTTTERCYMDNVNHPAHYETGKYECFEVMREVFGDEAMKHFCQCNAFKYVYRMNRKNGVEDAKKAIWYLDKYCELVEEEHERSD